MTKYLVALLLLFFAAPVFGQSIALDTLTPPFPTAGERHAADAASWVTAITAVALDAKASWDCPEPLHCFEMQGIRVGVTYGLAFTVKTLVHRLRPCSPDCGTDSPDTSFYSAHTAIAFETLGGPRLSFALPLAVSTAGLRVAAGKHWLSDVLVGAGIGAVTSRIR